MKQLDDQLAAAKDTFAKLQPDLVRAQQVWERSLDRSQPVAWAPTRGLVAHYPLDGDLKATIFMPPNTKPSISPATPATPALPATSATAAAPETPAVSAGQNEVSFVPGALGQAASFNGEAFIQGGDIVGFGSHINERTVAYDDPYTIAAWIYPTAVTGAIVTKLEDDVAKFESQTPLGHGLNLKNGRVHYHYAADRSANEGIRLETEKTVSLNQWHHVTLTYDGTRWASGVKVYVDGEHWKWGKILQDDMNDPAPTGGAREPVRIGAGGGPENRFRGSIDDVRIYNRALSAPEAGMLADLTPVTEIAVLTEDKRLQLRPTRFAITSSNTRCRRTSGTLGSS